MCYDLADPMKSGAKWPFKRHFNIEVKMEAEGDLCIQTILKYFEGCGTSLVWCSDMLALDERFSEVPDTYKPPHLSAWIMEIEEGGVENRQIASPTNVFWKTYSCWVFEAEWIFKRYRAEITKLHRQFNSADYHVPWPQLLDMFYIHYFLGWIGYLYSNHKKEKEIEEICRRSEFLKLALVSGYSKLQRCQNISSLTMAIIMDGINSAIESIHPVGLKLISFLERKLLPASVPSPVSEISDLYSVPLNDVIEIRHLKQLLMQPEIEAIYRSQCEFEGDYEEALNRALRDSHIMKPPYEGHGLTLSCLKIMIEMYRPGYLHPGTIIGTTIILFAHEFAHYLRRYLSPSIEAFYESQSPKLAQEFNSPSESVLGEPGEQDEFILEVSKEGYESEGPNTEAIIGRVKHQFMCEAEERAAREDAEERNYDWMEHYHAIPTERSGDRYVNVSIFAKRDIGREIMDICPRPKLAEGEGGKSIEMMVFGGTFDEVTLAASKTLMAACMRRCPIDLPKFQRQLVADMRTMHTLQTYVSLHMQGGKTGLIESYTTTRLDIRGCV